MRTAHRGAFGQAEENVLPTCPICERENGPLVDDPAYPGMGLPGPESFPMCRPCQIVSDIVEAAPLTAYMPQGVEDVHAWMRRLQDELAEQIEARR